MNVSYEKYNNKAGIYTIRCLDNDKIYVGSAKNLFDRICTHKSYLIANKHKNRYLQSSFNKYGEKSFVTEVIELVENPEDLIKREQYWIDSLDIMIPKGFNICNRAHSRLGVKASPETLLKMSKSLKGRKHTEEFKRRMSEAKKGHLTSVETRKKIGDAHRGMIKPSKLKRTVIQMDLQGNFIREWNSLTEAANSIKGSSGKISLCCYGKRTKHKNFKWRFK